MTEPDRQRTGYARFFSSLSASRQAESQTIIDLEARKSQLDDSSTENRNLFVGFLGVLIYTLVMTLAVSDEALLMGRMNMRIPLVDLGLPPVAWFSVVPVLLFILHVDLLHNLNEHLAKLQLWRELNQGHVDSRNLQPFFYDFAFARHGKGLIGWLLDWFVWLLIYLLPMFTLLVVQIRFGAYQNSLVSALHGCLTVLDVLIYALFYRHWRNALQKPVPRFLAAVQGWTPFINAFFNVMLGAYLFVALIWLSVGGRLVIAIEEYYKPPPTIPKFLMGLLQPHTFQLSQLKAIGLQFTVLLVILLIVILSAAPV
jgi:hypothetical protein